MAANLDSLIGGARKTGSGASRPAEAELPPPMIGWRFLVCMLALAVCLAGVGTWKVSTVFEVRDYEMEASRLQVLAQLRRDRAKAMEARISNLQGGDSLREAALNGLGMQVPEPQTVESILVSRQVSDRWERAAEAVRSTNGEEVALRN